MFKGGIHPPQNKTTAMEVVVEGPDSERLVVPLSQHIGQACKPLVKAGDKVKVGTKLGDSDSLISAPIHSPVSGVVKKVTPMGTATGNIQSVVIKNDHKNTTLPKRRTKLTKEKFADEIREAGIVGLGGAAFPTHIKLSPKTKIDILLINGAECEPYLCCDHRVMYEKSHEILEGIKIMMQCIDAKTAMICIEDNKKDAIRMLKKHANEFADIHVLSIATKYPHGAEKMLIKTILGREVPEGGLPGDVGVVVQNVQTAYAVYDAIKNRNPLTKRVVTVTGAVKNPMNVLVKIGTPISDIIDFCGGFKGEPKKIILGGPMMGESVGEDVPILKSTSGIVVLSKDEIEDDVEHACIHCGRCAKACPMQLVPYMLHANVCKENTINLKSLHMLSCIKCGCCEYECPSKIPLVERFAKGISMVRNQKK